jgi:CBS domain-containing protein
METVGTIMSAEVATVAPDLSLRDAVATMAALAISCVVVQDGPRPVGIVSERDMVQKVLARRQNPGDLRVADVMTSPVVTVPAELSTFEALDILRGRGVRRLPVVDAEGALIGIVTQTDLVRSVLTSLRRFTLHEAVEALVKLDHQQRAQMQAVQTVTTRYRALDLRCQELLRLLHRTARELRRQPQQDLDAFATEVVEGTRAVEALLGLDPDDAPALDDILRPATVDHGTWIAQVTERLQRASQLIARILEGGAAEHERNGGRG